VKKTFSLHPYSWYSHGTKAYLHSDLCCSI